MPVDVPHREEDDTTVCLVSPVVELLSAMHFICRERHKRFDPVLSKGLESKLSERSRQTVNILSTQNWPGMSHLEFSLTLEEFSEPDVFRERLLAMDIEEFLFINFNHETPKEKLAAIRKNPALFNDFYDNLSWIAGGDKKTIEYVLFRAEEYREDLAVLLDDLNTDLFWDKFNELKPAYESALAMVEEKLERDHPFEVMVEIRGAYMEKKPYARHLFIPSYFLHHDNIICTVDDTIALMFNINWSLRSGAEPKDFVEIFKALSDPTRVEILRQIIHKPVYGKVLSSRLGITGATVSRHLAILRQADIVEEERRDGVKYFKLKQEPLNRAVQSLEDFLLG